MNRAILRGGLSGLRIAALTVTIACGPLVQAARAAGLDAGTVLPVRLNTPLSSKDSQPGDTFTATLRPDSGLGAYGLPRGTRVEGVVRDARPEHDRRPGVLDLDFRRVLLPDGESYPIEGSLIGLDNKSVRKTPDGRLIATPSHQNDRLTYLGYGAGAGFVIGALTHRPFEDTVLGGGLGLLLGSLQNRNHQARDVNLKVGTELGVRLDQRLSLTGSDNGGTVRYHITEGDNPGAGDIQDHGDNRIGIGVMVGDRNINFDGNAQPFTSRGVVLVPVRPVLDALHVSYRYDADARMIRVTGDRGTVRLALGSTIAVRADGQRVRLEAPAQRLNGTIYVPIRFLELASGRTATYDPGSRTVVIDNGDAPAADPGGDGL
jgi:hypothetical protein